MTVLNNTGIRAGASGAGGGDYEIEKSLVLDATKGSHLKFEPTYTGLDNQKFTVSLWFKLCDVKGTQAIYSLYSTTGYAHYVYISSDYLIFYTETLSSGSVGQSQYVVPNAMLRDHGAWTHLHIKGDLTLASGFDRLVMTLNGNVLDQATANAGNTADSVNSTYRSWPSATPDNTMGGFHIGKINHSSFTAYDADMLISDVYILNAAKDFSEFGEFNADTGAWDPKKYTGGYTAFDSYLKFSGSTPGEDFSGNGNHFEAPGMHSLAGNQLAAADTFSDDITYLDNNLSNNLTAADLAMAFDGDTNTNLYCATNVSSNYILWTPSTPIPASSHNGYIWIRGGNGNGKGSQEAEVSVYINGSTTAATHSDVIDNSALAGHHYDDWVKFPITGDFTSIKIKSEYVLLRAVSFWENPDGGISKLPGDRMSCVQNGKAILDGPSSSDLDTVVDTPTNYGDDNGVGGEVRGNYCALNVRERTEGSTVAITTDTGNLKLISAGGWVTLLGTMPIPSTGKWYFESTIKTDQNRVNWYSQSGFGSESAKYGNSCVSMADAGDLIEYWPAATATNVLAAGTAGIEETAGWAIDIDNWTYSLYIDGVATSVSNRAIPMPEGTQLWPVCSNYNLDYGYFINNFGQRPFQSNAPSGFKCLCTQNLPDPTIADPSKHFDIAIDTGANILSAATALTDGADFVWIKDRANSSTNHILFNRINDSGMDGTPHLRSNEPDTEATCGTYSAPSGNSVAWAWDAGTADTSVSAGGLNSSVYDQRQTWSTYGTFDNHYATSNSVTNYKWEDAFNSILNNGGEGSLYVGSTTPDVWTPTSPIAVSSTIKFYTDHPTTVVVNAGLSDETTATSTGAVDVPHFHEFSFSGNITTISVAGVSGTPGGAECYFMGLWIDGKQLCNETIPTIASTYRANPSAGFSIVSYTGNRTANTKVAHGLNAKADFIIFKNRTQNDHWGTYHKELGPEKCMYLSDANVPVTDPGFFSDTDGDSIGFIVGDEDIVNGTSETMIAYCWSEVEGFSKFGSYTGNALADGPFVWCGFKPAFVMVKSHNAADWLMLDSKRNTFMGNPRGKKLGANLDHEENSTTLGSTDAENNIDFISSGFKIRSAYSSSNQSGVEYIFCAFAEHPFKTSRAYITTTTD